MRQHIRLNTADVKFSHVSIDTNKLTFIIKAVATQYIRLLLAQKIFRNDDKFLRLITLNARLDSGLVLPTVHPNPPAQAWGMSSSCNSELITKFVGSNYLSKNPQFSRNELRFIEGTNLPQLGGIEFKTICRKSDRINTMHVLARYLRVIQKKLIREGLSISISYGIEEIPGPFPEYLNELLTAKDTSEIKIFKVFIDFRCFIIDVTLRNRSNRIVSIEEAGLDIKLFQERLVDAQYSAIKPEIDRLIQSNIKHPMYSYRLLPEAVSTKAWQQMMSQYPSLDRIEPLYSEFTRIDSSFRTSSSSVFKTQLSKIIQKQDDSADINEEIVKVRKEIATATAPYLYLDEFVKVVNSLSKKFLHETIDPFILT